VDLVVSRLGARDLCVDASGNGRGKRKGQEEEAAGGRGPLHSLIEELIYLNLIFKVSYKGIIRAL
jgi:hypothetical protein